MAEGAPCCVCRASMGSLRLTRSRQRQARADLHPRLGRCQAALRGGCGQASPNKEAPGEPNHILAFTAPASGRSSVLDSALDPPPQLAAATTPGRPLPRAARDWWMSRSHSISGIRGSVHRHTQLLTPDHCCVGQEPRPAAAHGHESFASLCATHPPAVSNDV